MTTNQVIKILRELYPHRKVVMSQFTLWLKMGIAHPKIVKPHKHHPAYDWSTHDVAALAAHIYLKDLGLDYQHHGNIHETLTDHENELHIVHLPRLTIEIDASCFLDDVNYLLNEQQGEQNERESEQRNRRQHA